MKKKWKVLGVALSLTAMVTFPAYAGKLEQKENGLRYFKDTGTYAANEWVQENSSWYYFDQNGAAVYGWICLGQKWYYLDTVTGKMKNGWFQDKDGGWYYLDDKTGAMLSDTRTPDGYYVESNGKYNPNKGKQNGENISDSQTFPVLTEFARSNLTTDEWGTAGSEEALLALGKKLTEEWKQKKILIAGENVIYIDGTSIVISCSGADDPIFKLTKNGDHYRLYDYANIDTEFESALYALCCLISSKPQEIYDAMYTVAQKDSTIMSNQEFKTYGDCKIMYTVVGDSDYFYFSIK